MEFWNKLPKCRQPFCKSFSNFNNTFQKPSAGAAALGIRLGSLWSFEKRLCISFLISNYGTTSKCSFVLKIYIMCSFVGINLAL